MDDSKNGVKMGVKMDGSFESNNKERSEGGFFPRSIGYYLYVERRESIQAEEDFQTAVNT